MKKIMLIAFVAVAILFSRQNVNAQITLEHVYDSASYNLYMVNLEVEGYKYVWKNYYDKELVLYNLDHSIFKRMPWPNINYLPNQYVSILYISEHLFSLDDSVEYMFSYLNSSYQRYTSIISESGNILFHEELLAPMVSTDIPHEQMPIYNTPSGTKMILSTYNSVIGIQAYVYSLPGTLTNSIEPIGLSSDDIAQLKAFPNPNDGNATIEFKLPKGTNSGEIVLYNMNGSEVKRYRVDNTFHNLILNNSGLSSGTYMYQLIAGNAAVDAKKMIIIH